MSQSMNYDPGSTVAELVAERNALAAEVERLRDDVSTANQDATRLVYELANLGIWYDGFDPLRRLVEEVTDLRAQLEAATALNTDLLNDIIRLTGRVNELEDAVAWRVKGPGRGQAETG